MYIPSLPTYLSVYILTKSEFISSCIRPAVGLNIVQITRSTFLQMFFFFKWPLVAILDVQKSLLTIIFIFVIFFYKMAAGGHFGCPKLTFNGISGHFRSIRNFFFILFLQNDRRRSFWMSEIHFRSHFWPF